MAKGQMMTNFMHKQLACPFIKFFFNSTIHKVQSRQVLWLGVVPNLLSWSPDRQEMTLYIKHIFVKAEQAHVIRKEKIYVHKSFSQKQTFHLVSWDWNLNITDWRTATCSSVYSLKYWRITHPWSWHSSSPLNSTDRRSIVSHKSRLKLSSGQVPISLWLVQNFWTQVDS